MGHARAGGKQPTCTEVSDPGHRHHRAHAVWCCTSNRRLPALPAGGRGHADRRVCYFAPGVLDRNYGLLRRTTSERGMDMEAQVLEIIQELQLLNDGTGIAIKEIASRFIEQHGEDFERKVTPHWFRADRQAEAGA